MCLQYKSFENTGKRRNCSLQAISTFPMVFSTHLENFLPFSSNMKCSLQTFSVWKGLKFVVPKRVIPVPGYPGCQQLFDG